MPRKKNENGPGRGWNKGQGRRGDRGRGQNDERAEERIERILNAPSNQDEDGLWVTAPDEELSAENIFSGELNLTELVALRPYKMDELGGGVIQFRVSDKVFRAVQRVKERSGGVYDLMSDMHRDIYVLGLLIMSERHEDAFGTDFLVETTRRITELRKDTFGVAESFAEVLSEVEDYDQRVKFLAFLSSIKKRSPRVQRYYQEAILQIPLLSDLYTRLQAGGKEE